MIKRTLLLFPLMFALCACGHSPSEDDKQKPSEESEINMKLSIDNQNVDVTWEDNDSVKALMQLAKNTLTINMHEYGGFEQTGSVGSAIVRNDSQINTEPGDIVLYNGNAISVFYEPSSWSYTRLGHINMNKNELNTLLSKDAIVFVLEVK